MADSLHDLVQQWRAGQPAERDGLLRMSMTRTHDEALGAVARFSLSAQDAADVAQETCRKFLAKLDSDVRDADNYVRRIANNTAVDLLRRRKSEMRGNEQYLQDARVIAEPPTTPLSRLLAPEASEQRTRLLQVLEHAPEKHRRIIEQHYFEGRHINEIVEKRLRDLADTGGLDLSNAAAVATKRKQERATVDKQLERARNWLKMKLA